MPANLGLASVLATEQRTRPVAEWLVGQLTRLLEAAPEGTAEFNMAYWRDQLSGSLAGYLTHRHQSDPKRQDTHRQLIDMLTTVLTETRQVLNGFDRPASGHLPSPYTEAQLETSIDSLIDSNGWAYPCEQCGGSFARNHTEVDEKRMCLRCLKAHTATCHSCNERHLTDTMTVAARADAGRVFYCKEHVPDGLSSCTLCHTAYEGKPNAGQSVVVKQELKKAGIAACPNCSPSLRKLDCGHYAVNDGHRQAIIVDTEDDDRDRERVMERNHRVCNDCYEPRDNDERYPEHFRQAVNRVNGSLFTEIGSTRTFGVELEFCEVLRMPSMSHAIKEHWTAKEDASLPRNGVELASAILHGDDGLRIIKQLCDYASDNKWKVDARGGFHLHIGLSDDTPDQVAAIAMGYLMTYEMWRYFVAPSRSNSCKYCRRNRVAPEQLLAVPSNKYVHILTGNDDRRVWCNWHSYPARQTIELRIHQATKVYDKVANWAKAHARFCDWCAKLKTPKKVYERLTKHVFPREMFLVVSQEAWQDRELGRWFRERAEALHGKGNPLSSQRKLRAMGIDPKDMQTFETITIQGRRPYVICLSNDYYISDKPMKNMGNSYIQPASGAWGTANAMNFRSEADARKWAMAHADPVARKVVKTRKEVAAEFPMFDDAPPPPAPRIVPGEVDWGQVMEREQLRREALRARRILPNGNVEVEF